MRENNSINTNLKKFTLDDFQYYFQLVKNPAVMKMVTGRALEMKEAKTGFEKRMRNNRLHTKYGFFKILNAETNEFIGLAKLEIKAGNTEEAELGYLILPAYWGRGIATSVARELIETGKKHGLLKEIFAIIDPKNVPSRKILTNNGFVSKEFKDFNGLPGEMLVLKIK